MRVISLIIALALNGTAVAGTPESITLNVKNMTCPACQITVKKALEQVPGVSDVKIDFGRKTATARLDTTKASEASLINAVSDAGFPSTVRR